MEHDDEALLRQVMQALEHCADWLDEGSMAEIEARSAIESIRVRLGYPK